MSAGRAEQCEQHQIVKAKQSYIQIKLDVQRMFFLGCSKNYLQLSEHVISSRSMLVIMRITVRMWLVGEPSTVCWDSP